MHSLIQMMKSGSKPVTTETTEQPLEIETGTQPIESETEAQLMENKSVVPLEGEMVIAADENETGVQPSGGETVPQAVGNKPAVQPMSNPSYNTGGMAIDTTSKPSVPTELVPDMKQNPEDRKYIPCKKGRMDPLKMDMSKPVVMPLTSSQLSLQCIECHIIFSDHKSKERHLKLSHPAEYEQCILRNALFACYVCDRHFTNSTELMAHQKAHIEKKPFKCPICGQAFNKSSELTLHKKIHFGRDGYACSDCGKPCKTLTLLKYHRRTHTGERPYVCKECGKRFSMSKALQKHMVSHLPEGAEGDGGDTSATAKKNDTSTKKYPCSVCKATFKTTKTRLYHMKNKHNLFPQAAGDVLPAGQQVKQGTPIITPISICQQTLLQVEPIGPLQQVDANIDTEQIRRLIESLGNVQKVNQVVILGQVPPHAPPLELQQIPELGEPIPLNLTPPQMDLIELKQTESKTVVLEHSKNPCELMEQTIILEPITPDGQLENPSFSELGSHIATAENIGLTFVQSVQTEIHEGGMVHQTLHQPETVTIQSDPMDQMVCQGEVADLKQNLEQTVILELTSALMPIVELEQSQSEPQREMTSSSLVPTTELENTSDETVIGQQETSLSVPPLMPTVELELTTLQTDQQDLSSCPFVPTDTFTQTTTPGESQTNAEGEADSQMQTVRLDQVHSVIDGATVEETHENTEQEPSEESLAHSRESQEQFEKLSTVEDLSAKEKVLSQLEKKQVQQISHIPINIMSAQELVKVRKRKPARTFIFQGNMQELTGTTRKGDLQIDAKPAKRQRTKKSHLVVKFGPQNKEKKNKKQKVLSQPCQSTQEDLIRAKTSTTDLSEKKVPSQKKGRKAKKDKKEGHSVSTAEIKSSSSTHDSQVQQIKGDTRKNKIKKRKDLVSDGVEDVREQKTLSVFKKKKQQIMQKSQPKKTKDGKLTSKGRKKKLTKEQKMNTETNMPGPQITQDSLLLLKGHKQPQLKVYKLDPSKAPGQTQEAPPNESQTTSQQSEDITLKQTKDTTNESLNILINGGKKKGGRPKKNQKSLSLLSSLQVSPVMPESLPTKPKTTRKRKASMKVETEGVITSHSRRALECKDCGERFTEVSSLQDHKETVHIVESPGLTYTNGNIFEGVPRLDLCQPPKRHDEVIGMMSAATDWDTEAEMGEMALEDKEGSVSFPALNPSPSLPVATPDVEASGYEDKSVNTAVVDITSFMSIAKELPEHSSECITPAEVHSPYPSKSDQILESQSEVPPHFTSKTPLNRSTQTKGSEEGGPLASDEDKPTCQASRQDIPKNLLLPSSDSEVQATTDEDIKEGLLLEVDLVTVGEQNERDDTTLAQDSGSQNELIGPCNPEHGSTDTLIPTGQTDNEKTTTISLTSQTASCSTHQPEIKEEEDEILVQRKEEGMKGVVKRSVTRGRRKGTGRLKRGMISRRSSGGDNVEETEPEKEPDECQVVYQNYSLLSNSEINDEDETSTLDHAQSTSPSSQPEISPRFEPNTGTVPATSVPSMPSLLEESPEEQVVFELESVTTNVVEEMKGTRLEGVEEQDREAGQSPGIILERFLTSRQREAGDKEQCLNAIRNNQRQGVDSISEDEMVFREVLRGQEIKVEENISDPPLVAHNCQSRQRVGIQPQHQREVRTVLVKQESSLILNDAETTQGCRHIRWNVEQINIENTSGPQMESEETTGASSMAPEFNANQCIFYPVKEEEREVLLGTSQSDNDISTVRVSSDARIGHQTEDRPASSNLHEGSRAAEDYQQTRVRGVLSGTGGNDFANTGEAEADVEWQHTPELRDFLLQSSDEEDSNVFELSDPHLDSEAEAMAHYYKNQTSSPPQPNEMSHKFPTLESQLHSHAQGEGNRSGEPIDYFSKYFGWDTWVEIAQCTNNLSNMPNPVTAKEVAQFVGIHIAMGTLKFPSLKLYWQDFTKVPLIAEAMPLCQFLQLSRKLKLASPAKDQINNVGVERHDGDIQNVQQATTVTSAMSSCNSSSHGQIPLLKNGQSQGDKPNDRNCSNIQADPLWRVQPLLCRFQAGCLLLRREGDYGVDQCPLPLTTGKINGNKLSLHCTTLIGFGGLILHLDLKLDLSDKEAAVEKMVPRGSMVFLCKQELSTPAMLERLLLAGVHGAGKVGGARGQIGDEFVSSDGRLMLRRSHRGFILSTVGNGQRNMLSLIDNFEKAQMSARLNRDLQNLYRIPLTASAPTCWPQAVLWYLTDLALVNSWLMYRQDHVPESEPLTFMAFRLEVSKALILSSGSDTQDSVPPQPPTQKAHATSETPNPNLLKESPLPDAATRYDGSGHWPEQLEEGAGGRCRFGGCERTSRVLCLKCCVFLCISRNHNCFLNFHNQGSFGNSH